MGRNERLLKLSGQMLVLLVGVVLQLGTGAQAWSKEGHIMTCRIAQVNKSLFQFEFWVIREPKTNLSSIAHYNSLWF